MADIDTIVAAATPPGRGGVAVLRLSGPNAHQIGEKAFGCLPAMRTVSLRRLLDQQGELLDEGLLICFSASASFTGEPVIEFQGHGSPMLVDLAIARFIELGARQARPGEFSERAFLNGRMDLTQAEAIADLIDADSRGALRAAQRSLSGEFSRRIDHLLAELIALRVSLEAAVDFPDEETDILADADVETRLTQLRDQLASLFETARQGQILRDGVTVALVGAPNAGKSSLLNALSLQESAIVTDIPGTTRDVLSVRLQLNDVAFEFRDTAGLRETDDAIERIGIERARQAMQQSDLVVQVVDASLNKQALAPLEGIEPNRQLLVLNKQDRLDSAQQIALAEKASEAIGISALTGQGLEHLKSALLSKARLPGQSEGVFSARRRHLDALQRLDEHLRRAAEGMNQLLGVELIAEELRLGQRCLDEITGRYSADDLLGEIFSSFCIGK